MGSGGHAATADELSDHLATIERDGFTIVLNAFSTDLAGELLDDLDRLVHHLGITPSTNCFEGLNTLRVYNLLAHGPLYQQVPLHPVVLPIVDQVLGHQCLISSLSSIDIRPGERAQPIHADDQVMPLPKPHGATVANSMWALTDFTEANGATRVIPGSHLADRSPDFGVRYDSVPAEMPAGSILVWHGSLWHGGGANATDERRVGLAMNYCAGWVRQQENQQLGIPLDTVRSFPPRLQELCGFGTFRGLIGHIDRRTPAQRLLDGESGAMLWDLA
jgi:ectoine hydroxylase-related dioxygenase (phytanoyl-CoA dioxygenase family)